MADSKQEVDDDDLKSTQEREQWLRDRGVVIETAEDRKAADEGSLTLAPIFKQLSLSVDNSNDAEEDGVKFVCVPQDTTKSMTTVTMPSTFTTSSNPLIPDCGGDLTTKRLLK